MRGIRIEETVRDARPAYRDLDGLVARLEDWRTEVRVRVEQLLRDELIPVLRIHGRARDQAVEYLRGRIREGSDEIGERLERIIEEAAPPAEEAYKALLQMAAWRDSPWNPTPPFELFAETYDPDPAYRRVFWRHYRRAVQELSWEDDD